MIRYARIVGVVLPLWLATTAFFTFAQYQPDRLGEGFESKTLVMPDDPEELALTLNGKKRKLRKADFIKSITASGVDEKVIDNIARKFGRVLPKWFELIDRSFLPLDLCRAYKNVILRRMIMLK